MADRKANGPLREQGAVLTSAYLMLCTKGRFTMSLFQRSSQVKPEIDKEPPRLPQRWVIILGFSTAIGLVVGLPTGYATTGGAGIGAGLGIALTFAMCLHKIMD